MDDLVKRARGLGLILRLGMELYAERDFQRLLERLWNELTHVMRAERSSLFLVDEERGELYSVVAQREAEIRFPVGKGIAGAVAAVGESLLIPDAYQEPRFNPEIDQKTGFLTRSILTVPLKNARGETLGVAQVLNRRDGSPFDDEDRYILEGLASMAAISIETVQLYGEQKSATEAVIAGLLTAQEMRDPSARRHSEEVRAVSRAVAERMGLPDEEVERIAWAAALHDVGKIAVSDRVLTKQTPLTPEEQTEYDRHALHTLELLDAMDFSGELTGVETIAPFHHKRFDGGGFPVGPPEGPDVPLGARIIAAADALWLLMNPRWGESPRSKADALEWIQQRQTTDFDPKVVAVLSRMFDERR